MGFRFNTTYFSNQKRNTRENIWYKLYMLQNYNITMDMFKGATMRWSSINCYMNTIRRITEGKVDEYYNKSVVTPSLVKYIHGLMDSGIEPYKKESGEIQELIEKGILDKSKVEYIYSPVGKGDFEPDTSHGSSRCSHEKKSYGKETNTYGNILSHGHGHGNVMETEVKKPVVRYKLKTVTPPWASKKESINTPQTQWGQWK